MGDPKATFVVEENMLVHSNKKSPYIGMKLMGKVLRTVCRGVTTYLDGQNNVCPQPPGRVLLHGELGEEVGRFGDVVPGGPQLSRRMSLTPQMIATAFAPGEIAPGEEFKFKRRNSYYQ